MESQGIESLRVLPVMVAGELRGFVGLDNVSEPGPWEPQEQILLQTIPEILGRSLERLCTEAALREREARLRQTTENMLNMVGCVDANEAIRYASPVHMGTKGYRSEELTGESIFEFINSEDVSGIETAFRTTIGAGRPAREDVHVRSQDFRLPFDGALLNHQSGVWTEHHDLPKSITGQPAQHYLCSGIGGQVEDAITGALTAQAPLVCEAVTTVMGAERVFECRFSSLVEDQVVIMGEDVKQRKQWEDALWDSEQRCQTLVDAIDDAITVKDRDGRYILVNSAFAAWLGMEKQDILGRTLEDLFGPEAGRQWLEQDLQAAVTRAAVEFETAFPGQPDRVCFVRKIPIRDRYGQAVGVATAARDTSRYRVMEQQLLRAHRLEAAGRVAVQAAHDLRNFLLPLTNCPGLIKTQLPEDHPAVPMCDTMLEAARQIASITEDMLTLGRRAKDDRRPVDLNSVIRRVANQMSPVSDTLTLQLQLAPNLIAVPGSARQLARVIANLLSNAREAMHDNGTITIRTSNVYLDRPLNRYDKVKAGEYILLEVIDTGPGVTSEIQKRLFDAFFTTAQDSAKSGLGLGLTIVDAIVEDHQGYVDLTSELGRGSTFSVYLPVSRQVNG